MDNAFIEGTKLISKRTGLEFTLCKIKTVTDRPYPGSPKITMYGYTNGGKVTFLTEEQLLHAFYFVDK